jgi:hypothetical protein
MKLKLIHLSIVFYLFTCSCEAQREHPSIIDSSKVNKITIANKVYCSHREYVRKNVTISDRKQINYILGALNNSKFINQSDVRLNTNYGFFEIELYEEDKEYSYDILYTIYDGVVIVSMQNGDCFKNDHLEILIHKFFIE